MKKICLIILSLVVLISSMTLLGFGCDNTEHSPSSTTTQKVTVDTSSFYCSVEQIFENFYSVTITGIARNNTKNEFTYVSVSFTILDEYGNQIGTAIDNTNYLTANGTWKFSALATVSEYPAKYRFANVTAI